MGEIERTFVQNNVTLIKGFFDETLSKYNGESIALLHLDVDLYRSYKIALEHFWSLVAPGGIVLFDEYKNSLSNFPGASKAINEFFGDLISQIQYDQKADRYFLIKS